MARVGIFYGSTSYATEGVAKLVQAEFGIESADLYNVKSARAEDFAGYDLLVFGTSTWGFGGLQHDWDAFIRELDRADLSMRPVAVFASGDQRVWSTTFVNSMGIVYDKLVERGARVVGRWPVDGYDFDESLAVRQGRFVGLPLDRMNQRDLTEGRVREWVAQLRSEAGSS